MRWMRTPASASRPIRCVLDSKHPDTRAVVADAPRMADSLSAEARAHFEAVCAGLDGLGIAWTHNSNLVRGLDYYTHTVFEWTTDLLGAQGTVCAGGRYDGLVEQLGGGEVAAVGFAMGIERLALLLEQAELPVADSAPQVYLCWQGDDCLPAAQRIGERLRAAGLRTVVNAGGGSFKAQFKRADRSGADWALVLGPDELASDTLQLKSLRQREPQRTLTVDEALAQLGAEVAIDPIAV